MTESTARSIEPTSPGSFFSKTENIQTPFIKGRPSSKQWLKIQLWLAFLAQLLWGIRAQAENQVATGYEYYKEDNNRMTINTYSTYFDQKLTDSITTKGEFTYDGVSGSTPTGTLSAAGTVNLTHLEDIRRAENLELDWQLANHTVTPGFSHSLESDYESYGGSLSDAVAFNEKNTTLQYGISQNFDRVREANRTTWNPKYTTEAMVGISQLLSPKTIFNTAITFGNDSGYLSDPYRLAGFQPTGFPFSIGVPEKRPSHRNKEVLFTSVTQYFDSLDASLEGNYRFYHDSYGIYANTLGVTWHQWQGKHIVIEPYIRGYEQSAADFYAITFSGPFSANPPGFYSSDYRLSELYTVDYGLQITAIAFNDHLHAVVGYHRYAMYGLDGQTNSGMYPRANVYTVGLSVLW